MDNTSGMEIDGPKEQEQQENSQLQQLEETALEEDPQHVDETKENSMPSEEEEEASIKKKYGGLLPKKTPLIAKDHERAFFDSADWALGKQGQKPKGPLEALRPKLQPTPQQQVRSRKSAYAPADDEDGGVVAAADDPINTE